MKLVLLFQFIIMSYINCNSGSTSSSTTTETTEEFDTHAVCEDVHAPHEAADCFHGTNGTFSCCFANLTNDELHLNKIICLPIKYEYKFVVNGIKMIKYDNIEYKAKLTCNLITESQICGSSHPHQFAECRAHGKLTKSPCCMVTYSNETYAITSETTDTSHATSTTTDISHATSTTTDTTTTTTDTTHTTSATTSTTADTSHTTTTTSHRNKNSNTLRFISSSSSSTSTQEVEISYELPIRFCALSTHKFEEAFNSTIYGNLLECYEKYVSTAFSVYILLLLILF